MAGDRVTGNIVCFGPSDECEVGYWPGQAFWGRSIAIEALNQLLNLVSERPFASVIGSWRRAQRTFTPRVDEMRVRGHRDRAA